MGNPEIDNKIEEGISFYNQKNIPKAIITLREALNQAEGSELAEKGRYYLALSYFENDNLDEAADELPKCGAYSPVKVFELIKSIASKAGIDYKKLIDELPQKSLYLAVIEGEERSRKDAAAKAEAESKKLDEEKQKKLETEGEYDNLFVETMHAAPTSYFFPVLMGFVSLPAWGLGLLFAMRFSKAVIRFVVQYVFYYIYLNRSSIHEWSVQNINLSNIFGYSDTVNSLNMYVYPCLSGIYILAAVIFALQSFVFSYFEWYKMLLVGNITEVRNTSDVYINIGFDHHVNVGDSFNVYTRGKSPVLKGVASVLKHEDNVSLVEFRPNTTHETIYHPKVGDFVNYKW